MSIKRRVAVTLVLLLGGLAATQENAVRAPSSRANQWWAQSVFYEVFVRSFQDSNGDGIGDLQGLISRLDELQDLGVNALWLMPIYPSPSYHGYDVTDYKAIAARYGDLASFDALIKASHERGIRIILDFVANHTSSEHPWFRESSTPSSPKRDWYLWRNNNPGWGQPWGGGGTVWHSLNNAFYYGAFWSGMPDLNHRNPEVRAAIQDAARFWLERGVDGFRLDAARYIIENPDNNRPDGPENIAWIRDFAQFMKSVRPEAALVTEAWVSDAATVAKYFGDGKGQDLGFNFAFQATVPSAITSRNPEAIKRVLDDVTQHYPREAVDATFLANHDLARPNYAFFPQRSHIAASVLLTAPSTPFLYYGEEIGMPNGPGGSDEYKRTPMRWDETTKGGFTTGTPWFSFSTTDPNVSVTAQRNKPDSLYAHYRNLIHLRLKHEALRQGGYAPITNDNEHVFSFIRFTENETALVAINLDLNSAEVALNLQGSHLETARGAVHELTLNKTLAPLDDTNIRNYPLKLSPGGLVVLKIGEN